MPQTGSMALSVAPWCVPQWLQDWVDARLLDVNRIVSVGGKDYGVLRLQFDTRAVASEIEETAVAALGLALLSLVAGLVLIRLALARWLGSLEHLRDMVEDLGTGRLDSGTLDPHQAPTEIQRVVTSESIPSDFIVLIYLATYKKV